MSVIRSVADQWEKAEYASQLQRFFKQDAKLGHLFVGATSSITVCNLLAAMIELPLAPKDKDYQLELVQVFHDLYQSFLLLFIKEAKQNKLSQAEQLIVSITVLYSHYLQENPEGLALSLIDKSQRVLSAMAQLEQQRKNQRQSQQNMGRK